MSYRHKEWWKSKTIWVNVLALAFAQLASRHEMLEAQLGNWGWIAVDLLVIVNLGLRFITSQPVVVRTILKNDKKYLDVDDR